MEVRWVALLHFLSFVFINAVCLHGPVAIAVIKVYLARAASGGHVGVGIGGTEGKVAVEVLVV
eukprot:765487-Hanusia_phi.AAC.2